MKQWYTVHTKPNAEYQVTAALQYRQIETYLPVIKSERAHHQRKEEPFFPCYLFVRIDLEISAASQWQWIPGVRRILAFAGEPVPLPDSIIELIKQKLDALNANGGLVKRPFEPGEPVRITDGPLRDIVAVFDGPITPAQRVQVLLNFLGRSTRVWIDTDYLEKLPKGYQFPDQKRPRRSRGQGRPIR
jgi:transcriptional antiterminator RfaH